MESINHRAWCKWSATCRSLTIIRRVQRLERQGFDFVRTLAELEDGGTMSAMRQVRSFSSVRQEIPAGTPGHYLNSTANPASASAPKPPKACGWERKWMMTWQFWRCCSLNSGHALTPEVGVVKSVNQRAPARVKPLPALLWHPRIPPIYSPPRSPRCCRRHSWRCAPCRAGGRCPATGPVRLPVC